MEPQVLYEDEFLLAIDKPSGMVVNRGFGAGETLQDWVDSNFDFPLAHDGELRNGIVHRLDKETSGVILVAKTSEALEELQRQFKEREVEKVYLGLVHGKFEPGEGVIEAPIGRLSQNRKRFGVVEKGRGATTEYRVLSVYRSAFIEEDRSKRRTTNDELFSLLEFYPKTGRTHQIRVHAKHMGHPIVADPIYAGRKTNRRDRKWCPRLFLHAAKLKFMHPVSRGRVVVEAELPEDLGAVLKSLK
ncbi:MAG: hypothetical protein A2700_00955 [Candidatus Blackburnbacteria bacterium RIFCSPHIGHO2_01_FULL_44_64]|nr:MAG: hypothetical protein A2700_00955 [Candidatus Blackburnbacteria bacterium RIFCSPHIGHO2_01_FULL_44_64]OGY13816.1 MAG: hypothetical protein A3A62_00670 [Candidatus Blackburnbacteria bacterium RIFCSPLOWO2_01_FULL_44_43]